MKVFKASIEHFLLWLVGEESSAGQHLVQKSQHLWLQQNKRSTIYIEQEPTMLSFKVAIYWAIFSCYHTITFVFVSSDQAELHGCPSGRSLVIPSSQLPRQYSSALPNMSHRPPIPPHYPTITKRPITLPFPPPHIQYAVTDQSRGDQNDGWRLTCGLSEARMETHKSHDLSGNQKLFQFLSRFLPHVLSHTTQVSTN